MVAGSSFCISAVSGGNSTMRKTLAPRGGKRRAGGRLGRAFARTSQSLLGLVKNSTPLRDVPRRPSYWLGIDQHEGEHRRFIRAIAPSMVGAALNEDIAGPEPDLAFVQ